MIVIATSIHSLRWIYLIDVEHLKNITFFLNIFISGLNQKKRYRTKAEEQRWRIIPYTTRIKRKHEFPQKGGSLRFPMTFRLSPTTSPTPTFVGQRNNAPRQYGVLRTGPSYCLTAEMNFGRSFKTRPS